MQKNKIPRSNAEALTQVKSCLALIVFCLEKRLQIWPQSSILIPWHEWRFIYLFPEIRCRIQAAVDLKRIAHPNLKELLYLENKAGLSLPGNHYVIWCEFTKKAHFPARDKCVSWGVAWRPPTPAWTISCPTASHIRSFSGQLFQSIWGGTCAALAGPACCDTSLASSIDAWRRGTKRPRNITFSELFLHK